MKQVIISYHKKSAILLMLFIMAIAITTTAQSLKFNGTSQYGRVSNNAALQLKSFTIEMWVRPEAGGVVSANGSGSSGVLSAYPLLTKGKGESENPTVDVNYYAGINSVTNKVGFDFEDDNGSVNHPVFSATPLVSCVWQHVAASYNDTTGVWKVYINGVLDSTKTLSTNFHPQSLSTVNLAFGTSVSSTNATEGFFSGSMDEIRIWKRVRTDAEIATNKNLEISSHADLAARYGLNDGTGTSAVNSTSTGAAINASLFGTPVWNGSGFDATPSIVVGAIDFDGTNDHIVIGNSTALRASSFTLEGWIKIEGAGITTSTGNGGNLAAIPIITKGRGESESANLNMNYFLGIDANNYLVADFEEANNGTDAPNHPLLGNTQLKQNVWYHIAVSFGADGLGGKEWRLYINGVLDKQQTEAGSPVPEPTTIQHAAIGTAMTSTGSPAGYFNGKIDEVRIWNVVRSGTDISNNYLNEISTGTGLIGRWSFNECSGNAINTGTSAINGVLTNGAVRTVANYNPAPSEPTNRIPENGTMGYVDGKVSGTVSDRNNQPMTVKLFGRKKPAGSGTNFVVIGLPDTQYYTSHLNGGTNEIFKAQTQWIADHRVDSNIAYISQLGDCVENGNNGGNDIEWRRADTAIKKIENPNVPTPFGIPYSICVGNHDQGTIYNPNSPTTFYNQYFGEARFAGRPYYGGHYGSNNDNSFQFFSASGIDFIHIALEYNDNSNSNGQGSATDVETLQAVLNWADSLLKAHPTRKAILSTHRLLSTGNPANFEGPGQKIYDDLKDNPNLFLMLCGHVAGQGRRTDVFNGNTIHSILSDYQSGYTNGGNGYLRIMQFRPSTNTLSVKTFSPTAGALPNATEIANGNFDLSVNLSSQFTLITTVNNVSSSSNVDLSWPNLEPFTEYEWYVTISDGENELTSQVFSFTMAGLIPVNLLDFKGQAENKQVKLNWRTATEANSNRFDVERSTDGRSFTKIGEVAARGNSNSIQQYNIYDANPANGINHYRLKMINNDGSFSHSRVIHVSMNEKAKGFDIYPNPISGNEINIVFTDEVKGKATIRVYDINGRLRINTQQMANNNNLQLKHDLSPGMYIISIMVNNKEESRKIIIE